MPDAIEKNNNQFLFYLQKYHKTSLTQFKTKKRFLLRYFG